MHTPQVHQQLIETFYKAFAAKDFRVMADCYHKDVVFDDPAFGQLKGREVSKMWEMLLTRSKDLSLTFSEIQADQISGSAKWIARYTFSATGRMVTNHIRATFKFKDGKIAAHTDSFDLNKWFKMAFGAKGYLFILFPFLKNTFKKKAKKTLQSFIDRQ